MALDFPASPTDGQIYNNYYWDNTNSVWRLLGDSLEVAANFSNTATGTYTDGFDYKYVSFTSDGTLTVTRGGYADVLLVGGGGSGGCGYGGGGGAGGVLYVENIYLPAGSLDVVVGDGGSITPNDDNAGTPGRNGEASSLWKYFVAGGGGGGSMINKNNVTNNYFPSGGGNGASGGGDGGNNLINPGSSANLGYGTPGLGNNGGQSGYINGGGGGGAGAAGGDAGNGSGGAQGGGDGGDGIQVSITGSAVYYGGGGAGIAYSANTGTGGQGGGADGVVRTEAGNAGTDGLGGGGSGGSADTNEGGGDGGSGIVIVRVRV